MVTNPDGKCLEAPDQQVRTEGTGNGAEHAVILAGGRDQIVGADQYARHQIVVSPQILGRAVHHEIDAVVERTDIERCGKRRIDQRLDVPCARERRQGFEVDAVQIRIRGALGDDQLRRRPQRLLDATN